MKGYTNEEITEGLSDHGVIDCRRIIRNPKSPQSEPTATLILTFNSATLPDRISIRTGLTERVRPYIPLPRRCFNCQQYGHSGAKCRRAKPVCVRCSLDVEGEHNPDNCQLPLNCIHCHEPHSVSSKTCSRYLFEKEMLAIKTREHLTFPEARARARLTFNVSSRTYAAAAGNTRHRTAASSESLHDSSHPSSSFAPATSAPKTVDVTNNDRAPPSNPPATKRHLPRPGPAASQPHSPTSTPTKPAKQQKRGDTCVTRAQGSPGAEGPTMPPDKTLPKGKPSPASQVSRIENTIFNVHRRAKKDKASSAHAGLRKSPSRK